MKLLRRSLVTTFIFLIVGCSSGPTRPDCGGMPLIPRIVILTPDGVPGIVVNPPVKKALFEDRKEVER